MFKKIAASKTRTAVLVAIALTLSFALMGVWVRMMQDSFDSFQQTYLRILLAGIVALYIFRKKFSKNLLPSITKREWGIYGLRAFMAYTIGVAGFTIAAQHTSLGAVSFISTLPLLGLLGWILFREKIPTKSFVPIAVSIVGLVLLTGVSFRGFSFGVGEWAALICALGFDIGFLMSRMHNKERSNFENTTILLLLGWIPVFIISMFRHESILPHDVSLLAIVGLLLAVVSNVFGLYAINYVFGNLKAYVAGNILLLEGVFSLCIGLLFYGEAITLSIAIGGLLIIVSSIAINTIEKAEEEAPAPFMDEQSLRPAKSVDAEA